MSNPSDKTGQVLTDIERLIGNSYRVEKQKDAWGYSFYFPQRGGADYTFSLTVHNNGQCDISADLIGPHKGTYFWNTRLEVEGYQNHDQLRTDYLEICGKALLNPTRVVRRRSCFIFWDFDLIVTMKDGEENLGGASLLSFGSTLPDNQEKLKIYSSPAALQNV